MDYFYSTSRSTADMLIKLWPCSAYVAKRKISKHEALLIRRLKNRGMNLTESLGERLKESERVWDIQGV